MVRTKNPHTAVHGALCRDEICEQLLRHLSDAPRSWRLEVAPSTIAGAGEGVHLIGSCAVGTAVAIYCGVAYAADDLPTMHKLVLPNNSYVMARRDGIIIDGRPDGTSQQFFEVAVQRDIAAGASPLVYTELAVGQKVNHPARGERPNVRAQPLDLQPDEFVDLHRLLPTVNFRPPAPGEPSKRTVVLIAERDLRDEELWLDYKLNPDGPLESWYAPVLPARAGGDE